MTTTQETTRSRIIPVSELAWQEIRPGRRMKPLWAHEETNRKALMIQFDPGVQLPMHKHIGDELVFVVEGAVSDEFGTLTAGNMGYRPNGCIHTVASKNGATVIAFITGGTEPTAERGDAPPSRIFALSELAWVEVRAGVGQKHIWEDPAAERRAIVARFEPGAELPRHRHSGDELIFVIEGANADESGVVTTGNMSYRPNGCTHTVTTQNGCTVLAIIWGHTEQV